MMAKLTKNQKANTSKIKEGSKYKITPWRLLKSAQLQNSMSQSMSALI